MGRKAKTVAKKATAPAKPKAGKPATASSRIVPGKKESWTAFRSRAIDAGGSAMTDHTYAKKGKQPRVKAPDGTTYSKHESRNTAVRDCKKK